MFLYRTLFANQSQQSRLNFPFAAHPDLMIFVKFVFALG
jgi:hypothetical protein